MGGHSTHGAHGPSHTGDIGEDYNITVLVAVGTVGTIALIVTIMWLKAIYLRADHWQWEQKVAKAHFTELEAVRQQQDTKLVSYDWADPAKGRVTVPVIDVQHQVLDELRARQARQGAPAMPTMTTTALPPAAHSGTVEPAASETEAPGDAQAHDAVPPSVANQPKNAITGH